MKSNNPSILIVSVLSSAVLLSMFLHTKKTKISFWQYLMRSCCCQTLSSTTTSAKSYPVLEKRAHYVQFGGKTCSKYERGEKSMKIPVFLKDDYFYVRDDTRKDAAIMSHLDAENVYTTQQMEKNGLVPLKAKLYTELLSHVQETDASVPYPYGPEFEYFTRTEKGQSYTLHCRRTRKHASFSPSRSSSPSSRTSQPSVEKTHEEDVKEEVLLNVNELAIGKKHCEVGSVVPSPKHDLLAYAVDLKGDETYTTYFKHLSESMAMKKEVLLDDVIENMTGQIAWGKDASSVYYGTHDEAHRSNKVWRHVLGTQTSEDELLYTENDTLFGAFFGKSRSGRFIVIGSSSSETTEFHYIDLDSANPTLKVVEPRQAGVQYSIEHHGDHFYIVTNRDGAINFKLLKTPISSPSGENWTEVLKYDAAKKIDDVDCFKNHMVISGRENGLTQLWIMDMQTAKTHRLEFDEPLYTVGTSVNKEFETDKVRISMSSLTTPWTTYDYNMSSQKLNFLKEKPVPNYDRTLYTSEIHHVPSADGTVTIPMSLVYRKDQKKNDGTTPTPVHLYGYGSYEICIDPSFMSTILPLLDHGVTYAIAHIRGGGEKGRSWYEDAKYLTKAKTFDDFISCAEYLIDTKVTKPEMMTCEGRSAGGLLMGSVLNMRPDLFKAAIAGVPFVDVMNSMCDSSIPLTTGEWEEWGNPNEEKYFHYMLSYSPYENVKAQAYPNMLITSGLYDPRVAYWEPTKWAAKLRDFNTGNSTILLKMDMSSGHFSASDRYHYLSEKAIDIAYILDQLGLAPSTQD